MANKCASLFSFWVFLSKKKSPYLPFSLLSKPIMWQCCPQIKKKNLHFPFNSPTISLFLHLRLSSIFPTRNPPPLPPFFLPMDHYFSHFSPVLPYFLFSHKLIYTNSPQLGRENWTPPFRLAFKATQHPNKRSLQY